MCPVTPSSKPNFENKRNEAASRSLRCRRSSATVANLGGPGKPGFFTGAVAMFTSKNETRKTLRAEYSTARNRRERQSGTSKSAPEYRVTQMNAGGALMVGSHGP